MNSILKVEALKKIYRSGGNELVVLEGIDFSVPAGSSCAVVGPSGSGKTTLLGICAGLDEPTSGAVILDGVSLGDLDEDGRARLRNRSVG